MAKENCRYYSKTGSCRNGNNCKFRHQEQDAELSKPASRARYTDEPINQEESSQDSSTSASTDRSSLDSKPHSSSMENVDASETTKGKIPPIIQQEDSATTSNGTRPLGDSTSAQKKIKYRKLVFSETSSTDGRTSREENHTTNSSTNFDFKENVWPLLEGKMRKENSATTSNGTSQEDSSIENGPPQEGSTKVASPSSNTEMSPLDDGITGTLPSSSAAAEKDSSATNETIPPTKQELSATPTSIITSNNGDEPLQDDLTASSSSSSSSSASSKKDVDGLLLGKSRTNEPIKQEIPDPTSSSNLEEGLSTSTNTNGPSLDSKTHSSSSADKALSREDVDTHTENVDASVALPLINQEHSSTATRIVDNVDKDSSEEDADAHIDNGRNGAIPPFKQELSATPTHMITSNNGGEPLQGGLTASSSRKDEPLNKGLNADAPPFEPPSKLPQDSSTAASTSANTQCFPPDDLKPLNGPDAPAGVSSSLTELAQVSQHIDLSPGQPLQVPPEISSNNGGDEPLQDGLTTSSSSSSSSSATASPPGSHDPDWYPQRDGILPSSFSREDFDDIANNTLYGPE